MIWARIDLFSLVDTMTPFFNDLESTVDIDALNRLTLDRNTILTAGDIELAKKMTDQWTAMRSSETAVTDSLSNFTK